MKKFLSLILALSMIISCVSMVSFVANAEEASERVGARFTVIGAIPTDVNGIYPQVNPKFDADDVEPAEEITDNELVTQKGYIKKTYSVFNDGETTVKFALMYYGGSNKFGTPEGRVDNLTVTLAPGEYTRVTMGIAVYLNTSGEWVHKVSGKEKYYPLSNVTLRLQLWGSTKDEFNTVGSTFVVYPETDGTADAIYTVAKAGSLSREDVFVRNSHKLSTNGNAENGNTGWFSWNSGKTTVVDENEIDTNVAVGTNHVAKFEPTGLFSSASFDLAPYIIQDPEHFYYGNGAGTYTITFKAKAEEGRGGKFSAYINSYTHADAKTQVKNSAGEVVYTLPQHTHISGGSFTMTDEWQEFTYKVKVTEDWLQNLYTLFHDYGWTTTRNSTTNAFKRNTSGSDVYRIYTRFDGNGGAFKSDNGGHFEYYVDDLTVSYEAPPTPTPDAIAIKVTGTGDNTKQTTTTTYTPNPETGVVPSPTVAQKNHFTISNEGVFKGVDFEGKTEKTLEFVVLSDSADTIKIEIYPTIGWKNDMYGAPGLTGDDQYPGTGRITLKPGVPQRVSITIPEVGYLKEAKADSGTSYTKMNLRMNYFNADGKSSRSLIATDVIYILPIDESVIDNYAYSAGMKSVKVAEVPASVELAKNNKIEGANLDIGSTLTVNYYATLAEGYEDAVMKFTRNGKIDTVSGEKQSDGMYKFAYKGINAQCMGDVIDAELVLTDDISLYYNGYSVKKYATNKYNADATEAKDLALNKLLANMLAYGAESQKYQHYKEDDLVNKGIDWAKSDKFVSPGKTTIAIDGNTEAGAKVKAVGVNISSEYKLKFTFDIDATKAKVFLDNENNEITDQIDANGVYYTAGIKAHQNSKEFTVIIKVGNEVKSTVTYSVDNYISRMHTNEKVGNIVKAIHTYGQAAKAYDAVMSQK